MLPVVRIYADPEGAAPAPASEQPHYADAHERAIQALRDVRHLLPREGVEIVDAVLDQTH